MSLVILREQFETDVTKCLPKDSVALLRNEQGQYKNKRTQALWEGYMLYHSASYDLETAERVRPVGSYIVGHVGKTGLVHFSKVPHRHASKRQGKEEALRLVEEHKKNFGLFRCIELFKSPVPEAE